MKHGDTMTLADDRIESKESESVSLAACLDKMEQVDSSPQIISGVAVGTLAGLNASGVPLVDFKGNPLRRTLIARSTLRITREQIGREVALMFEDGNPQYPMVIGFIHQPRSRVVTPRNFVEARVDGERVALTAEKELILTCGKASITLTAAGKILIRGTYLLTRSSGLNRIRGGSVEIN